MSHIQTARGLRVLAVFFVLSLQGCSLFISTATEDFGNHLQQAMLDSDDPDTVAAAIPTLLLLQGAILKGDPNDIRQIRSTSELHASYASLLSENNKLRRQRLHEKALALSLQALCLQNTALCDLQSKSFADFSIAVESSEDADLPGLYQLGKTWAGWIKTHTADWHAVAQLAQVKYLMTHIINREADFKSGEPHLYLGVLESLLPPALGGKPDVARQHFETARSLSEDKNLMVHVLYARHYARMMFDRELHDRLLKHVMSTDPHHPGLTLINTLARQQAQALLNSADTYF